MKEPNLIFMDKAQIYFQISENSCGSYSQKLDISFFHAVPTTNCANEFSYHSRQYRKRTVAWNSLIFMAATETKNQTQK